MAECRLHSAYVLNAYVLNGDRKVLPVDPSHQRQLFRVPVTAAGGGPRSVPTRAAPTTAAPPARYCPLPFSCPSAPPARFDPVTPGAIFRGCLSLGRRGHGGAGLSCAPLCRAQCIDRSWFVGGIARPAERRAASRLAVLLQMVFANDAPLQACSEIQCAPTKARFFAVIGIQITLE